MNNYIQMKRQAALLCGKLLLALLLAVCGNRVFSQNTPLQTRPPSNARHFFRAPDVMPGTLSEMNEAPYWIAKMEKPDEVVLSVTEIQAKNKSFQSRMENPTALDTILVKSINRKILTTPGLIMAYPDLYVKTPQELSLLTKNMVSRGIAYLKRGKYGNMLAIEYSSKEVTDIENEMGYSEIGGQIMLQSGITVEDVQLRIIPSNDLSQTGLSDRNRTKWDMWNLDMIPLGSAVQVLHTSKSGGSVFVLSENGYGWISSNKVAFGTRAQTEQFNNLSNFVTCTGDKVPYYSNANVKYVSGWFRMGDRLPLTGKDSRVVSVPIRQANGKLSMQEAWLAPNADVHVGYLPYTRKNVAVLAVKLVGNIYDWTGGWLGRNHATALRDVFACFGFKLPGYGELMSAYSDDNVDRMLANKPKEEKIENILSHDPFLTIQITRTGHSQLLMGNYNGVPIVNDTHGYSYTDASGKEVDIRRSNVGTIEFPDYFLKEDVIFVTLK